MIGITMEIKYNYCRGKKIIFIVFIVIRFLKIKKEKKASRSSLKKKLKEAASRLIGVLY